MRRAVPAEKKKVPARLLVEEATDTEIKLATAAGDESFHVEPACRPYRCLNFSLYHQPTQSTMKYVQSIESLAIPEDVTVSIKSRIVTVTGPRGQLVKALKHVDVAFEKVNNKLIKIYVHNGDRKHVATLRTVKSLIANLIKGVTVGYKYKMRFVYAHFPINVNIIEEDGSKIVEIRNFLGDRKVRKVSIPEGVTAELSAAQKDELTVTGNSVEDVSQLCADVQQICRVRNKDIRKFLDGIYVSERGHVVEEM